MAMLAEQKSKQKWSEDPRNMKWSTDKDRYGYQMLEKMGWADGKGLGKKQNGNESHVKIKKRKQNLGLGAKESHDNDWIAQQEDFNNLLSALQQHGGNAELQSEEQNNKAMLEVAKASRKRVFYKKFIRSKDTSQYSQKDMACIFGSLPSQSAPATPLSQSDEEVESEDSTASCPTIPCNSSSGLVTYTSKHNIQEYFARRMKELQDGKGKDGIEKDNGGNKGIYPGTEDEGKSKRMKRENQEDCLEMKPQKLKKRKKSKALKFDVKQEREDEELVSVDIKTNLCERKDKCSEEMNEKGPERSRTKTKRYKVERTDDSIELENGVERVSVENDNRSCGEKCSLGEDKIRAKKRKKRMKKDKLDRTDDLKESTNDVEHATEDKKNEILREEALSFSQGNVKTKKRKRRMKRSFTNEDVCKTTANGVGSVDEETERTASEDKMKMKNRDRENFAETKRQNGSEIVGNGRDDDTEKDEQNLYEGSFFKGDIKVKRKKSKKIAKIV